MPDYKSYQYRDRAEGFRRMASEAMDERTRKVLNDLVAENIARAEELEALSKRAEVTIQSAVTPRKD
jgi:hypothetical protein